MYEQHHAYKLLPLNWRSILLPLEHKSIFVWNVLCSSKCIYLWSTHIKFVLIERESRLVIQPLECGRAMNAGHSRAQGGGLASVHVHEKSEEGKPLSHAHAQSVAKSGVGFRGEFVDIARSPGQRIQILPEFVMMSLEGYTVRTWSLDPKHK